MTVFMIEFSGSSTIDAVVFAITFSTLLQMKYKNCYETHVQTEI